MADIFIDNEIGKIFAPVLEGEILQNQSGGAVNLAGQNAAKSWSNWNSSSGTPVLRDSLGVSSLTDRAVGRVTINLTNPMLGTGYAIGSTCYTNNSSYNSFIQLDGSFCMNVSAYLVQTFFDSQAPIDVTYASTIVQGDLA